MTHVDDDELSMLFAFDDGSQSFVNGFEAGQIWQQIEKDVPSVIDRGFEQGFPVRIENVETYRRMAACRKYRVEFRPSGTDGWIAMRMMQEITARPQLTLVE